MKKKLAAGIDIGGTNTAIGLVDRHGVEEAVISLPTRAYPDVNDFVDNVAIQLKSMLEDVGNATLLGIGIGAPNGNFMRGTVEFAPNLAWKGVIPLSKMFRDRFNLPVYLDNDANAATTGERIYGAAKGMNDFILVTLGTGVGSGFVVNGRMVRGHDGFAGELGHVIVIPDGRVCGCGRKGCLETYVSATGVKRTIVEMLSKRKDDSELRNVVPEKLSSKVIYQAALAGDEFAKEAFEYTGKILGFALANSVAYTSPEAIFIFGGLAKAGEMLMRPTNASFEHNLLDIYKGNVKLLPSGLPDFNAAILGASAMVWHRHEVE